MGNSEEACTILCIYWYAITTQAGNLVEDLEEEEEEAEDEPAEEEEVEEEEIE